MSTSENPNPAARYVLFGIAVLVLAMLAGLSWMVFGPHAMDFAGGKRVAMADYRESDPTGVPAELKSASLLERGEYLTRAADCAACHSTLDGVPFAGGRAFVLPVGTLYSTNITPDKETGIGSYSDANFLDVIHKGIGRDDTKLYPAMPFASYTYMTDADALAIKAYLFSLKPVHAPARRNTLSFPFNQRMLMGVWSMLFNPDERFEPHPERSAAWNRGAYLAEAMGHCGECHTPRNLLQALNERRKFAGAVQSGWRAYNVTPDRDTGVGAWSDADLAQYLASGHADGRGTAAGPMGEAVDMSLRHLTPGDIAAIVTYMRSTAAIATAGLPRPKSDPAPQTYAQGVAVNADVQGRTLFAGACVGCHGWSGVSPVMPFATLTGTRSVNDPAATNVAQIILAGGLGMPAFGTAYSDVEIANLANYVTARFGATGSALTAQKIAMLRKAN